MTGTRARCRGGVHHGPFGINDHAPSGLCLGREDWHIGPPGKSLWTYLHCSGPCMQYLRCDFRRLPAAEKGEAIVTALENGLGGAGVLAVARRPRRRPHRLPGRIGRPAARPPAELCRPGPRAGHADQARKPPRYDGGPLGGRRTGPPGPAGAADCHGPSHLRRLTQVGVASLRRPGRAAGHARPRSVGLAEAGDG